MKSAKTARALRLPSTYAPWLAALKARVRSAQLIAAARVNHELLRLYWDIGTALMEAQAHEGWGAAIIPRLARDLHAEFPEIQGFSVRNLKYMLRFARENGAPQKVQQTAALLSGDTNSVTIVPPPAAQLHAAAPSIVQQPAALLPWGHHLLLMDKVKDRAARAWYMQAAVENGWSRSVLAVQIAQRAHRRTGVAATNFAPPPPPPHPYSISPRLQSPLSPSTNAAGQNGLARRPLPLNICLVSRDTSSPEPTCSSGVCRRAARARPISANGARNLHKDGLPQHSRSSRCGDRLDSKRPPDKDRRPSTLT